MTDGANKGRERALRYLASGSVAIENAADGRLALLRGEGRAPVAVERTVIASLTAGKQAIRESGRLRLAQMRAPSGARSLRETRATPSGFAAVDVNPDESPLSALRRLKGRDGAPFIADAEFRAGERLRVDYTRGLIMPRLGANWEASVSSGRRAGGVAELTETALAARLRVEKAIGAVGPELSGLLVDICCFLKGIEQVEGERGLPARSAKVLLKAGLAALARHYEPPADGSRRTRFHWGAADYRPEMTAPS